MQLSANPNIQVSGKIANALATARSDQAVAIAELRLQPDLARVGRNDRLAHQNGVGRELIHGMVLAGEAGFYATAACMHRA